MSQQISRQISKQLPNQILYQDVLVFQENTNLLQGIGYSFLGASFLTISQGAYWIYYSQKPDKDPKFQNPFFFGLVMFLAGTVLPLKWKMMSNSIIKDVTINTSKQTLTLGRVGFLPWSPNIQHYPLSMITRSVSQKGTPSLNIQRKSEIYRNVVSPTTEEVKAVRDSNIVVKRNILKNNNNNTNIKSNNSKDNVKKSEEELIRNDVYFLERKKFINYNFYERNIKDAGIQNPESRTKWDTFKDLFKKQNSSEISKK